MTRPTQTRIHGELDSSGKRLQLKKQAQAIEAQWRMAHGIDGKLQSKREQKATRKRQQRLERGEARRREERKQQRLEREVLRVPVLVTKCDGPRLIQKQAPESDQAVGYGTPPFGISRNPEDRREPDGTPIIYVTIREVRRLKAKGK